MLSGGMKYGEGIFCSLTFLQRNVSPEIRVLKIRLTEDMLKV